MGNIADIAILVVVLAAFALAVTCLWKHRGSNSCGGACGGCGQHDCCARAKDKKD